MERIKRTNGYAKERYQTSKTIGNHLYYSRRNENAGVESSNIFLKAIQKIKQFIQAYLPFTPLIEEFANHVEHRADIEAGNSFRGLFTTLGELLNSFKEIIKDGLC